MSNPVISLSSVSFAWSDGTPVFSELDLLVPAGRCGLVGINGAGKSTLLRSSAANWLRRAVTSWSPAGSATCRKT